MFTVRAAAVVVGAFVGFAAASSALAYGQHCGVSRWQVKTVSDGHAGDIDCAAMHSVKKTIPQLYALACPTRNPGNFRLSAETHLYRVQARIVKAKKEADHDYHLVIADPDDARKTMNVEFPASECSGVCASPCKEAMAAARAALEAIFCPAGAGSPGCRHIGSHWATPTAKTIVEVTGVAFFDLQHLRGTKPAGMAPNLLELHPVLAVQVVE